MKKINKNKWYIITVLFIAGLFYWFQLRPASIRKQCGSGGFGFTEKAYQACLHRHGLE